VSGFPVSPPIGKALAEAALNRFAGTVGIGDAKGNAVVIAEIELGNVLMKVDASKNLAVCALV
jgi:hypothetical protein